MRLSIEMVEMKIKFILFMAVCLVASAQVHGADKIQNVGGDFGRSWLESYLAQNPKPGAQDNDNNLSSWGGAPKGNASAGSNLFNQQKAKTPPVQDWLGITTPLGIENNTKNNSLNVTRQGIPFSISKTITPIHQIDASWNQTLPELQFPQPDKSGLIYGIPAETYYSIGPAYFNF